MHSDRWNILAVFKTFSGDVLRNHWLITLATCLENLEMSENLIIFFRFRLDLAIDWCQTVDPGNVLHDPLFLVQFCKQFIVVISLLFDFCSWLSLSVRVHAMAWKDRCLKCVEWYLKFYLLAHFCRWSQMRHSPQSVEFSDWYLVVKHFRGCRFCVCQGFGVSGLWYIKPAIAGQFAGELSGSSRCDGSAQSSAGPVISRLWTLRRQRWICYCRLTGIVP